MAIIKTTDQAHQFRIDIEGRLSVDEVGQVRACWLSALGAASWRKFTVDISQLTGYDLAGSKLLREMHAHGAYMAARTPLGLVFLQEISHPELSGPTLVPQSGKSTRQKSSDKKPSQQSFVRAAASGE